ncbi:hypothetical protein BU23DRAFT_602552 [Bimuria novae-zelandiae CBS 107.79]|uniref:Protein kinase domain-containing protein n=1 Tax=Bimuria novae-zelandiae CBS 107.79 TaxID=1447943 RepID=A0A6A5US14_9PLEO|nr:hypothetical protein BU23DRAFT_602552 [Bimuria novae-zelandiae CBS 107.79]
MYPVEPISSSNDSLSPEGTAAAAPIADITHRVTRSNSVSKTKTFRDPGRYTAPEQDQIQREKINGRRADIWSFGCVLSEMPTYAIRLDCNMVDESRRRLRSGYKDMRFYDYEARDKDVKPAFFEFVKELEDKKHDRIAPNATWIAETTRLVRYIVVRDPMKRPKADKIRDRLHRIDHAMKSEKRFWLCDSEGGLRLDTSVNSGGAAYSPGPANISARESPTEDLNLNAQPSNVGGDQHLILAGHRRSPSITVSEHGGFCGDNGMDRSHKPRSLNGVDTWF